MGRINEFTSKNVAPSVILEGEDYGLKASINTELSCVTACSLHSRSNGAFPTVPVGP